MCELFGFRAGVVGYDLSGSSQFVFVNDESFESYGAAGVYFVCADSDFCAEAVSKAVAKARAAVVEYVARIDETHKLLGRVFVCSDNGVGMA